MTQPTILFSPRVSAISAQGGVLEVLVRVQAPDQPDQSQVKVTPKRLSLVVDRSGSMDGQPLTEALRCVTHIADCLTPADQLSVVVYDDDIDILRPLAPLARILSRALDFLLSEISDMASGCMVLASKCRREIVDYRP